MLLSPTAAPPAGDRWAHESKLDGYRCLAELSPSRVRLWSRAGSEWTGRLSELDALTSLGDVVLDGEVVVVTPDGRADFELVASRIHGRRHSPGHPITFYVFDVLQIGGRDLCDKPWTARSSILDDLDLAGHSDNKAQATIWAADGAPTHEATQAIQAEGTVSKRLDSLYRPGRSQHWLTMCSGAFRCHRGRGRVSIHH